MPSSHANLTLRPYSASLSRQTAPAEMVALKEAFIRRDEHAVRESLDKVALSPQALHYWLYYALLQKSSPAIKEILLQHPHCNLEVALDLAVQRNDLILAKQALQRGADPEKVTIRESTNDMRALLTYARRKKQTLSVESAGMRCLVKG